MRKPMGCDLQKEQAGQPSKKPYAAPELAVHGSVEEITQFLSGGPFDGIEGS